MTVLVDPSAWVVEYLRGTGSPYNSWIREAIRAETPLAWTEPILYELTAGVASPRRVEELRAMLLPGSMIAAQGLRDWEDAAQLYRSTRAKGLMVRSSIDCLIAAVALRRSNPVLALDRDFAALSHVSDLVLEHPKR